MRPLVTGGTTVVSRTAPRPVGYPARRSPKPQRLGEGATLRPLTRCPLTRRRVPHPATPDYLGPDRGLPATTPHLVLVQRVQSRGQPARSSALGTRTRSPDRPRSGRQTPRPNGQRRHPHGPRISLSQSRPVGAASARAKCHAARLDHCSGSYSASSGGHGSSSGRTGRAITHPDPSERGRCGPFSHFAPSGRCPNLEAISATPASAAAPAGTDVIQRRPDASAADRSTR